MHHLFIMTLCVLLCSAAFAAEDVKADTMQYQVPENKTEAVLILDYVGGLRAAPADDQVALKILADGTVQVRNGALDPITLQLTQDRLQSILHEIVAVQKIKELNTANVKKAVAKAKKRKGIGLMMADAASTKIVYNDGSNKHEVLCYSLRTNLRQYPDVEELKRVAAIEKALNQIRYEAIVGGADQVRDLLALANKALTKQHPELLTNTGKQFQFGAKDLQSAWYEADGTLRVSLLHKNNKKDQTTIISVQIMKPENEVGKATVRVSTNPSR